MNDPAYNIYLAGISGVGKKTTLRSFLEKLAPLKPVPLDWCYVYNFKSPENPMALRFPAGQGRIFKKQMMSLIEFLKQEIPKAFESKDFEKQLQDIIQKPVEEKNRLFEEFKQVAEKLDFEVKTTKFGILTVPFIDGKILSELEYSRLSSEKIKEIESKKAELEPIMLSVLKKIRRIEENIDTEIKRVEQDLILYIVKRRIDDIREHYPDHREVLDYLDQVQKDILEENELFRKTETPPKFLVYRVNLLVNNFETKGAPVIFETFPTYYNLIGKVEKHAELGVYTTDFTKIKAGSLARANGGYLIMNALDLLQNVSAWDVLKRCLKNKQIMIEDLGEKFSIFPTSGIRPHPIPLHVKVILIGGNDLYYLLYTLDEDFQKIFKVRVDFYDEMEFTKENLLSLIQFISYRCHIENTKPVDKEGIKKLIEYAFRLTNNQKKLTLRMNEMNHMLLESHYWALQNDHSVITEQDVEHALHEKRYRSNLIEEIIQKEILEGRLIINIEGLEHGQINALAFHQIGDYNFGCPVKITAQTFLGRRGVINIEREVQLSGKIHNKAILILSGYLGSVFAQQIPLSISVTLCFEQSYVMVEGDSALAAELYCILSSISQVPIRQDIAIMGSMNQKGEIQPVGGVNEKIEGYFYTCKSKGLTETQGVILPHQNVTQLVLRKEILDAIKEKKFHLYAIKHVDEGIFLLTNKAYSSKAFYRLISKKLHEYSRHQLIERKLKKQ